MYELLFFLDPGEAGAGIGTAATLSLCLSLGL